MKAHEIINRKIEDETKDWTIEDYKAFAYDRLYDELAADFYYAESFERSQNDWRDYIDNVVSFHQRGLG